MTVVVITADDIGMTRGITDGILRCVDRGAVDSVSLLANGRDFEHAASELRRRPQVRVGVHVNLVEGAPLSAPASVALLVGPCGRFTQSFGSLWLHGLKRRSRQREELAAQIEQETRAQIKAVRAAVGGRPLHIDSHRHVHMIPWVLDIYIRLYGYPQSPRRRNPHVSDLFLWRDASCLFTMAYVTHS